MKKIAYTLFIILFVSLFSPAPSRAEGEAALSISVPASARTGETFTAGVFLDTGGTIINSADVSIAYPADLLSFEGYQEDDSLIKIWLKNPTASDGVISFAGIIPGGVAGVYDADKSGLSQLPLVSLLFKPTREGQAELSFKNSQILKNDGEGTELPHSEKGAEVAIVSGTPGQAESDGTPPDNFEITYLGSSFFSRTPSMILFYTKDQGSGIKNYEMRVGGGAWIPANNPEPVERSLFPEYVTVRAYDYSGNFKDSSIRIPGLLRPYAILIIALAVLSGILLRRVLKYRA
ncbi:MAG TPA: cohesin domain-containing protein [Candidatus Paceibacterota bacterium]|nr:cohesin domain-containing protein [Candidatus Paceibacterota bacterium]